MTGFVGSRAKKRRRNIFITLSVIIVATIFILLFPIIETDNNQIIPNDNIIPDPRDDLTSLISVVEELELSLFQKDQKIKFRDGQIKNLQNELKNLQSQFEELILQLKNNKNIINNENFASSNKLNSLEEKITKMNVVNNKNISRIKNLNKTIDDLNNSILFIKQESNNNNIENQKFKKDKKILFSKNRKLENSISDLNNFIKEQKILIDSQLEEIKELKDKSHHGS